MFGTAVLSFGQVYVGGISGFNTDTNVLGPIPLSGTLLVDYDFFTLPDTMDVYYDGNDIFNSGSVSGNGQFVIPYGPGASSSVTIIMDQAFTPFPESTWTYNVSVAPEPETFTLFVLGIIGLVALLSQRQRRFDMLPPPHIRIGCKG